MARWRHLHQSQLWNRIGRDDSLPNALLYLSDDEPRFDSDWENRQSYKSPISAPTLGRKHFSIIGHICSSFKLIIRPCETKLCADVVHIERFRNPISKNTSFMDIVYA
jgi:hypothetical protein